MKAGIIGCGFIGGEIAQFLDSNNNFELIGLNDVDEGKAGELIKNIKNNNPKSMNINELIKKEFLFKEVAGRSWILSANQKHKYFTTKKISYHLDKIYAAGIVDAVYNAIPQARAIILFGSYSRGEDISTSDIDIGIITPKKNQPELKNFEKKLKRKVQLHFKTNFNDYPKELKNNISNGIVLDGYLEVL